MAKMCNSSQIELLKDLLVACLLRDYTANSNNNIKKPSISNIISGDDTVDVVEVTKAAAGQPHLSATSAPRASDGGATKTKESLTMEDQQQQRKKKKLQMEESEVMTTHHPTAARVTYETAPHTSTEAPTKEAATATSTTKSDTVALETTLQAQITEVEMLCLPKNCVLQTILHLQLLAKVSKTVRLTKLLCVCLSVCVCV